MQIRPSETVDIEKIFFLYNEATKLQEKIQKTSWAGFEEKAIIEEIQEGRHFSLWGEGVLSGTFVITFDDAIIWHHDPDKKAVYLHRIATHPDFRGRNYTGKIVEWTKNYALQKEISLLRMDTTSGNENLNNYYIRCGFDFIGVNSINWTEDLPLHYKNGSFSLFEMKVDSND